MVDGVRFPSVTEIITISGWSSFGDFPKHRLDRYAARGQEIHDLTEAVDRGLPLSSVPRSYQGPVSAYVRFRDDYQVEEILDSEIVVVSMKHHFAGQLDRRWRTKRGLSFGDLKSAHWEKKSPSWGMQLSAYEIGYTELHGLDEPHERVSIQLLDTGAYEEFWWTEPKRDAMRFLVAAAQVNDQLRAGVVTLPERVTKEVESTSAKGLSI